MQSRARRVTSTGAAAFALAGSAALAMPTVAAAETKTVPCGATINARPGDHIIGTTLLGLPLDLGVVTQGVGQLLNGLCAVTVNVVNTVVSPVPVVGPPLAGTVNGGVAGVTNTLSSGAEKVGNALSGNQGPNQQPRPGNPQSPPGGSGSPPSQQGGTPVGIPDSTSPVLGGNALPVNFFTGYAPMRDYSAVPLVNAGLYGPSPGLRYGGEIPGYAPEFGVLGQDDPKSSSTGAESAGQGEALPGARTDGVGLSVLIAVLVLSGVSAGLARTWVLRRMTPAT